MVTVKKASPVNWEGWRRAMREKECVRDGGA